MDRELLEATNRRDRGRKTVAGVLGFVWLILLVGGLIAFYVYVAAHEERYEPIDCDAEYGSRMDSATSEESLNFWGDRYIDCLENG